MDDDFDPRALFIELWSQLPDDFRPSQLDERLYINEAHSNRYGQVTLLARYILDADDSMVRLADEVISFVRNSIRSDPSLCEFPAPEIASALSVSTRKVEVALGLIRDIGWFWSGATNAPTGGGYTSIRIESESAVAEYLAYLGIEKQVEKYLNRMRSGRGLSVDRTSVSGGDEASAEGVWRDKAFILMQIDPNQSFTIDVRDTIVRVCEQYGVEAARADDLQHAETITDVVLEHIRRSEFVIADLTGERPNVYYEIGYAHAHGKRPMMFRRADTPIHFDLAGYNVPSYSSLRELEALLSTRLEHMLGGRTAV